MLNGYVTVSGLARYGPVFNDRGSQDFFECFWIVDVFFVANGELYF